MKKYEIVYKGKIISLNDFYSGSHWSKRSKAKVHYRDIFSILFIEAKLKWIDKFRLDVRYNSRHDVDNTIGICKIFVDTMKGKYIKEDNKKHYKGLSIIYDETLKSNTFIFTITQLK